MYYEILSDYKWYIIVWITPHECSLSIRPDRMDKAIECINLLHQGFENLIEKGGRVYQVYRNGVTFVALGNVPYGVKEDPIDSIAQLAFDFMTWAWKIKVPSNLMDGFQLQIGIHSGAVWNIVEGSIVVHFREKKIEVSKRVLKSIMCTEKPSVKSYRYPFVQYDHIWR